MENLGNEAEELDDFLSEIPTNRCGEGGCSACDIAFHRACDPIIGLSNGVPTTEWDVDTELDIRTVFTEDELMYGTGGEG